jgi:hypothetical protein
MNGWLKPDKFLNDLLIGKEFLMLLALLTMRWKLDGMMPTAFRGQRYFDWTAKAKIFRPT